MTDIANNLLHATLRAGIFPRPAGWLMDTIHAILPSSISGTTVPNVLPRTTGLDFPSVGLGWLISNEAFMYNMKNAITNLKLKATYGLVGNDQIGDRYDRSSTCLK